MEYIEGDSLGAHIRAARTRGCLSPLYEDPIVTLTVLRDVCRAVHYAHTQEHPVVHCDIKPGNVLLDLMGHPYVVDFGIAQPARWTEGADQRRGPVRGTPAYMAPEQLTGRIEDIGPWVDIYALGTVLYELDAILFPLRARVPAATASRAGRPSTRLELKPLQEPDWAEGDLHDLVTDRNRQVRCIEAFKDRLIARINERRPKLGSLQLLDRTVQNVELLRAMKQKCIVFDNGRSFELPWAALPGPSLVALALDVLQMNAPEDALALGIYCWHARLDEETTRLFGLLKGTPYEVAGGGFIRERQPS